MQKIKGTGYTLDKKQEHIYTFYGNMVYHYRLSDLKLLKSFKSLSYICRLALSNDEKHLAVTDMSGHIAIHSAEMGEMTGKSRMEGWEASFIHYMEDDSSILFADQIGKIMRLDTSSFRHEVLLDLHYEGREIIPLLLDADKMQIVEVVCDGVGTKLNVCSVSDLQFREQDYTGIVDSLSGWMQFGKDYYINLNYTAECYNITFFNQMGVLHKVSLPVKHFCTNYDVSKSRRYLAFCDFSAISNRASIKILDLCSNKIVKTCHAKFVGDMDGTPLKFIRNDTALLIPTLWEGIYLEPLDLP